MKTFTWIVAALTVLAAAQLRADDTEIYGTVSSASLAPNVMIVFDTSGSMGTEDVPGTPYDGATTYSGSYSTSAVYERYWSWYTWSYNWRVFASDVTTIACDAVKTSLLDSGYASAYIRSTDFSCGGYTYRRMRLGNFLNYDESGVGTPMSRMAVAKQVISDLINNTENVRFGLMRFNYDQGGSLIAGCGADKQTLLDAVAAVYPDGWTPLAETLAETGLYFAGMQSWFNSGVSYTSPMQERCQKNYIIIMTDGEPTEDRDAKLTSGAYINGDVIGDYDQDHGGGSETDSYASNGSDYLDDVAAYLYENDCNPDLGDGTAFDKQNIVTFTIGFKVGHQLLYDTAANGGGEYFTADNVSELALAFDQILASISEENAVFVAPVVPISRMNRTYAGDKIYLGFFKPQQSGRWLGNIKRYALDNVGILFDAKGYEATTADGLIKDNALSWWTTLGDDGPDVEKGGAAEVLNLRIDAGITRSIYTYTGSSDALTATSNDFSYGNTALTNSMLQVTSDSDRQSLIDGIHDGFLGDIIHSEPVVVFYSDPDGDPGTEDDKTLIFSGANDGMLHCFDDEDGSELWSFIPPSQLSRLSLLDNTDHDYFVDGSPVVHQGTGQKIMIFGERRGGSHYTALDISDFQSPTWLYSIGPDFFDPDPADDTDTASYETLGQSWGKPERCSVATGVTVTSDTNYCTLTIETEVVDAFLIPGGYDNNQDQASPNTADAVGRAVFAVEMSTGQLAGGLNFNAVDHSTLGMSHSVVDVSGIDHDGDGIVSRVYFGDLGGNVFAAKDDEAQNFLVCGDTLTRTVVDGTWSAIKLFSATAGDGIQRKILYAPDAVEEEFGEYIYFGTGDRTDPGETGVVNRFYAVKNDWAATATLTEADLVDVTDNLIQLGTETEKELVETSLESSSGWFIRLEHAGEKIVASPRVYGGVVYFTTYTPSDASTGDSEDPCAASTVRGIARLYAVNYKTGAAVHDFSSEVEVDNQGQTVALGKLDRALAIGTAIPSAPVIAILGGGARLFVGVEGGIVSLPTIPTQDMYRYFWNQIF
jgi:type IV pilus assembly protein PilY1